MKMINIRWLALGAFTSLMLLGSSTMWDAMIALPLIAWTAWLLEHPPQHLDIVVLEGGSLDMDEAESLAELFANDGDEEYDRVRVLQVDTEKFKELLNSDGDDE